MKPWGNTDNPTKSPERATLLQSPGWNEGEARYETLGTHSQYDKEPCKGDTPAKPDMKPWENNKQSDNETCKGDTPA